MDKKAPYFNQIRLLVQILPHLNDYSCFALKGGTAINLFIGTCHVFQWILI